MNGKKVLVLGATGAMGVYLVPELISMGYEVDAVSLDEIVSDGTVKYRLPSHTSVCEYEYPSFEPPLYVYVYVHV